MSFIFNNDLDFLVMEKEIPFSTEIWELFFEQRKGLNRFSLGDKKIELENFWEQCKKNNKNLSLFQTLGLPILEKALDLFFEENKEKKTDHSTQEKLFDVLSLDSLLFLKEQNNIFYRMLNLNQEFFVKKHFWEQNYSEYNKKKIVELGFDLPVKYFSSYFDYHHQEEEVLNMISRYFKNFTNKDETILSTKRAWGAAGSTVKIPFNGTLPELLVFLYPSDAAADLAIDLIQNGFTVNNQTGVLNDKKEGYRKPFFYHLANSFKFNQVNENGEFFNDSVAFEYIKNLLQKHPELLNYRNENGESVLVNCSIPALAEYFSQKLDLLQRNKNGNLDILSLYERSIYSKNFVLAKWCEKKFEDLKMPLDTIHKNVDLSKLKVNRILKEELFYNEQEKFAKLEHFRQNQSKSIDFAPYNPDEHHQKQKNKLEEFNHLLNTEKNKKMWEIYAGLLKQFDFNALIHRPSLQALNYLKNNDTHYSEKILKKDEYNKTFLHYLWASPTVNIYRSASKIKTLGSMTKVLIDDGMDINAIAQYKLKKIKLDLSVFTQILYLNKNAGLINQKSKETIIKAYDWKNLPGWNSKISASVAKQPDFLIYCPIEKLPTSIQSEIFLNLAKYYPTIPLENHSHLREVIVKLDKIKISQHMFEKVFVSKIENDSSSANERIKMKNFIKTNFEKHQLDLIINKKENKKNNSKIKPVVTKNRML